MKFGGSSIGRLLRQYRFQERHRLLGRNARQVLERLIAPKFRGLHTIFIELEEGKNLTRQLQDEVLIIHERQVLRNAKRRARPRCASSHSESPGHLGEL